MYLIGIDIDAGCGQLKADLIRKQKLLKKFPLKMMFLKIM